MLNTALLPVQNPDKTHWQTKPTTEFNPDWVIAEQELRWYFRDAPTACGISSSMGPFTDILRAGILPHGSSRELRDAPDTLDGMVQEYVRTQPKLMVFEKVRRIHHKLHQIGRHHARTLELAYGCDGAVKRVSLSLASECPSAHEGYLEALDAVCKMHKKKLASGGKATPKRKGGGENDCTTMRTWLMWLVVTAEASQDAPERALLDEILAEATERLHSALHAYWTKGGSNDGGHRNAVCHGLR